MTEESQPLVTFISPSFNHSRYVLESLDSIRLQNYPNIEHIIIDDCSKDNSPQLIEQWIDKHQYKCHFVRHNINKGISFTLNESLEMATGKYWNGLSTDDYIVPDRTRKFVSYLESNPDRNMVFSDCILVNDQSEVQSFNGYNSFLEYYTQGRKDITCQADLGKYETLLFGNYIPSSLMLRKSIFEKIERYDTRLKTEDLDMWLKIARVSPLGFIDEALTFYRFHEENAVKNGTAVLNDYFTTLLKQRSYCMNNQYKEHYFAALDKYFTTYVKLDDYPAIWKLVKNKDLQVFTHLVARKLKSFSN